MTVPRLLNRALVVLALHACVDLDDPLLRRSAEQYAQASGLTKENGFGPLGCWDCNRLCCNVFRVSDGARVSFWCKRDGSHCSLLDARYPAQSKSP